MFQERNEFLNKPGEEYEPSHPLVVRAYQKGGSAHEGQFRADGTEYFKNHCVPVTQIIQNEMGITQEVDPELHAAALMHDLIEDTGVTYEDVKEEFGVRVANIIRGVSKLDSKSKDKTFETNRLMLTEGYEDSRVWIVKIADRLHNFRTMEHMSVESQMRKGQETLEIYAPLARALGMWNAKVELEDWSFRYLYPEKFVQFRAFVDQDPRLDLNDIAYRKSHLESILSVQGIKASVEARKNGYWTLYQKNEKLARTAQGSFRDINDVVSYRVITETPEECYRALFAVHTYPFPNGHVVEGRFDEYIVEPRQNKYRAIQTTIEVAGFSYEIAIATQEMEAFNNDGIVSKIRAGERNLDDYLMKSVFVKNGERDQPKLKLLLKEATGIDLAYTLGESIGSHTVELETIEGSRIPVTTILKNAAVVKVITDESQTPDPSWLNYSLEDTKDIIARQLQVRERAAKIESRKAELDQVLNGRGILELSDLELIGMSEVLIAEYGCESLTELSFLVTRSAEALASFSSSLDALSVTKTDLAWTSVSLTGSQDSPGILGDVVQKMREMGRSIIKDESRVYASGEFSIKLIIKDLDSSEQTSLSDLLTSDPRFESVKIV